MSDTPSVLEIRRPDDWHLHLRDGAMLASVVPYTARQFARAIVMPNLLPPVTTTALAAAYRERILAALPPGMDFTPLMTAYLTDRSDPADLVAGHRDGVLTAVKLYPAKATTNAEAGVTDVRHVWPVLEAMQACGMPLLIHGEVTDAEVDVFDREAVFIERILAPLRRQFPELKIVLEHITTRQAVEFILSAGEYSAATITPHHLHIDRNAMFEGGIRPHAYCLPVAKRELHRRALREVIATGHPRFFLGTDSAPHAVERKESACGCAGIFNAPCALESYLEVFEEQGALAHFEAFASEHGPRFYGLPLNTSRIRLLREPLPVPDRLELPAATIVPFHAGGRLRWRLDAPPWPEAASSAGRGRHG